MSASYNWQGAVQLGGGGTENPSRARALDLGPHGRQGRHRSIDMRGRT